MVPSVGWNCLGNSLFSLYTHDECLLKTLTLLFINHFYVKIIKTWIWPFQNEFDKFLDVIHCFIATKTVERCIGINCKTFFLFVEFVFTFAGYTSISFIKVFCILWNLILFLATEFWMKRLTVEIQTRCNQWFPFYTKYYWRNITYN